MAYEGVSAQYLLLDSGFRNRIQYPYPGDFEVRFNGGDALNYGGNNTVDDDIILIGATTNNNNTLIASSLGTVRFSPAYTPQSVTNPVLPAPFPYGFRYVRGVVAQTNMVGLNTVGVRLATDHINYMSPQLGSYDGLYIELYDNINPTVRYHSRLVDGTGYVDNDPNNILPFMTLNPPIGTNLSGFLYSIRTGGLPADGVGNAGQAVIHGTITASTINTATLTASTFLSSIDNFYRGMYFLIVDTDDMTNYPLRRTDRGAVAIPRVIGIAPTPLSGANNSPYIVGFATASALPTHTYTNDPNGINNGNQATITDLAPFTRLVVNGVLMSTGDTILVKNEAGTENGVYTVTFQGTAIVPFVLTRLIEYNYDNNLVATSTRFGPVEIRSPVAFLANTNATLQTVAVATTTDLGAVFVNSGGVGDTLTGGLATIDGVALTLGMFVLVKNQATTLRNGMYQVTSLVGPVLTRRANHDTATEINTLNRIAVSQGTVNINSVWNLATPIVTMSVDAIVYSIVIQTVAIATTVDLGAVFANSGGVGDTLTGSPATIDGVALTVGMRVLVKDQTATLENGIYQVTTLTGPVLTRYVNHDTVAEVNSLTTIAISQGTVNTDTTWNLTAVIATMSVDAIVYITPTNYDSIWKRNVDPNIDTDFTVNVGTDNVQYTLQSQPAQISGFSVYSGSTGNASTGITGGLENAYRFARITAYNGTTRVLTLDRNFNTLPSANCRYEILKLARPNECSLSFRGGTASIQQYSIYDVNLVRLSLPNNVDVYLDQNSASSSGGEVNQFAYFTVELSNSSGGKGLDVITTNNPYMQKASFVCFVREDTTTANRVLLTSNQTQPLSMRLTDSLRLTVRSSSGDVLKFVYTDVGGDIHHWSDGSIMWDRRAPYPPDKGWNIQAFFSLTPR
jgi:hypothetical protein